jgi:GAF domain-containing protein
VQHLSGEQWGPVLQRVVNLVKEAMPAAAEASITVLRNQRATTAAFTGELALQLDESQYGQGYGPCMDAALGGRLIETTDGRAESRWPDYMPIFHQRGALSSLPVPVPAGQSAAGLNVYAPVAGAFTDQHRRAAVEFAAYAGVALTNMDTLWEHAGRRRTCGRRLRPGRRSNRPRAPDGAARGECRPDLPVAGRGLDAHQPQDP